MTRQRNPRRVVLEQLRALKDQIKWATWPWDIRSTVLIPRDERDVLPAREWERPRRPDEYPEVQPKAWASLARDMDYLIDRADAVRAYARRQADLTRASPPAAADIEETP